MANPAVIKAAVALFSDERTRKGIGWIIAAILSPLIVLLALLCSLSAGSSHNASVIELCFNGGALPPDTPAEYVAYIEDISDITYCFVDAAGEYQRYTMPMSEYSDYEELKAAAMEHMETAAPEIAGFTEEAAADGEDLPF